MAHVSIKENSVWAKIAAFKLGGKRVAIVFGNTIHLYNTPRHEFVENASWLRHELKHVEQYAQHGFFPFLFHYVIDSARKGYRNNRFEVEARNAEQCDLITYRYQLV